VLFFRLRQSRFPNADTRTALRSSRRRSMPGMPLISRPKCPLLELRAMRRPNICWRALQLTGRPINSNGAWIAPPGIGSHGFQAPSRATRATRVGAWLAPSVRQQAYQGTEAMRHSYQEFHDETVTLTWCACELCNSVGPRSMTLVRNHHEYTVELYSHCYTPGVEEELVRDEAQHSNGRHSLRNQIPR